MKKRINELKFTIEKKEKNPQEKLESLEYKRDVCLLDPESEDFRLKFKKLRFRISKKEKPKENISQNKYLKNYTFDQ